jgi:hypothetical protein
MSAVRRRAALSTLQQVTTQEPDSPRSLQPGLDRDLEAVCLKCLRKEPAARYGSAEDLVEDLRHWLAGEPMKARLPALASQVHWWLRQNFGATGRTVALGAGFGLLASLVFWAITFLPIMNLRAAVYARLPGLARPWLGLVLGGARVAARRPGGGRLCGHLPSRLGHRPACAAAELAGRHRRRPGRRAGSTQPGQPARSLRPRPTASS